MYTLFPLEDFKAFMGVDDREDRTARFCLVTASLTIEGYCKRRFLRKQFSERIALDGALFAPLREYPVVSIRGLLLEAGGGGLLNAAPGSYRAVPGLDGELDVPCGLELARGFRGLKAVRAVYVAGYTRGGLPPGLGAACMELAVWNLNRYRGRRVGMAGPTGGGNEGWGFETSMPENVRSLLEPFKRKLI